MELLFVIADINAQSERLFCAAKRIKMYLRTTMSQQRLKHLMLLHVHKRQTDSLSLVAVTNNSISGHDHT